MRRASSLVVMAAFVLGACTSGPPVPSIPEGPTTPSPRLESVGAGPQSSAGQSPSPPAGSGATPASMPVDVVNAIDAILDARTDDERVTATRAVLESVGVTISGDANAVATSSASMVVSPEEVEIMAREAADRNAHRATLVDFADTFGGMSLLPPNDALATDLVDGWLEAEPSTEAPADANVELDLAPLAPHLASVINGWVTSAESAHASTDPELVRLTYAPLLLAELARRRPAPVDLAQPFSASDVRLGWLEITVLTAGLRSMLGAAEASGVAWQPRPLMLVTYRGSAPLAPVPFAEPSGCELLKQMIDSRVPLVSTYIGSYVGAQVKGFITGFVNALFGAASIFARAVGQAFKVLSIIAKVQALIMIYSESTAEVTLDPAAYHRPDGSRQSRGATVEVGVPDAAWAAAKQARESSPFATAMRACARFLKLPVWQDLVDVGNALADWKVEWELTRGSQHVEIPARDQFTSGRMERPLTRTSDHTALDAITYDVLPERREDHPGTEQTDTVEFCAHVHPKEPPNGLKDLLSVGGVVLATATRGYSALVNVISNLLAGWVRTVVAKSDCGQASVSFHVPLPGKWNGTITAATESSQSGSSAVTEGTATYTRDWHTSIWVRDVIYVGGADDGYATGFVYLNGRQYTSGNGTDGYAEAGTNVPRGCAHDVIEQAESGGTWGFDGQAGANITLYPDGRYTITWDTAQPAEDIFLPGQTVTQVSILEPNPHCVDIGTGTEDRPYWPSPLTGSAGQTTVEGRIDPDHPGNILAGSQTFTSEYDSSTTTVTWTIVHDGPIRLPGR